MRFMNDGKCRLNMHGFKIYLEKYNYIKKFLYNALKPWSYIKRKQCENKMCFLYFSLIPMRDDIFLAR